MNDVIYHEKILVTVEHTDGKNNDLRMKPFFPCYKIFFLYKQIGHFIIPPSHATLSDCQFCWSNFENQR